MALGLFGSLIIGLILKQLGAVIRWDNLMIYGKIAQLMMGPAIGVAVAYSVDAPILGRCGALVAGAIGAGTVQIAPEGINLVIGEPMGAFVAGLCAAEASKWVSGKTKIDIVLVPAVTILLGGLVGSFLSPGIALFMKGLGNVINTATALHPFPMGILVAIIMGMILTLPISSAALAISLGLSGLAAGASLVGCCAQMVGFAVSSYRENGFGGLLAQGLGTSMLQVPNIIKNPLIWIPPTLTAGILGPFSTTILKMESNSIGAGMGTSGFVGQFGTIAVMGTDPFVWGKILLFHFLLPGILSFFISEGMRKKGWIRYGDMELNVKKQSIKPEKLQSENFDKKA